MVAIYQTAYPRLKKDIQAKELDDIYTPTDSELRFAQRHCKRNSSAFLGLLVQPKTVQRLGRFTLLTEIPTVIVQHIRSNCQSHATINQLRDYYKSGTKDRHIKLIRKRLGIKAYEVKTVAPLIHQWAMDAAKTKEALADIINVTLEYLVLEKYELPGFSRLLKICQSARVEVNEGYYNQLQSYLTKDGHKVIQQIISGTSGDNNFGWNTLKNEPKRSTPRNIQDSADYSEKVGLEFESTAFVQKLEKTMTTICHTADKRFPDDETVRIEKGKLIIGRVKASQVSPDIEKISHLLKERLEKINLLDVILNVEQWLNFHTHFGPLSGFESRLDNPFLRFVLTLFCYGTNIGPTETARSVQGVTRKQVAWLNLKRTTEDRLGKAIAKVSSAYKKFRLIDCWGSGNSVSADGKLWDLYEDNLLSEYHIHYGSYGGIAYYHVSDTYIALFSRFIPCGVYEAIYILDGLLNDESDFTPDTIHGDTQAQSTPVFGLAYLLGIKLMPRIRNIKDLNFYKPNKTIILDHIQSLCKDPIKWEVIEKHYPYMLRTAMSVKAGKITASTILRRFGTKNRKNKLYFAFRELGRVVRTMFLLEYITDLGLRKTIQAATCKSEEFNQFASWLFFANDGKITSNLQSQQGKIVKYNHLLANMTMLYNVNAMIDIFNQLKAESHNITKEHMASFSPYHMDHLGRLGSFKLDLDKKAKPMIFDLDF